MVYRMKQVLSLRPVAEAEQSGLSLLFQEIIDLGRQNQELRAGLPDELIEDLFVFALIEAIKPFYLETENFDLDRSIEQCVDLFLNGVKA